MTWDDLPRIQKELASALATFDWRVVDQRCTELVNRLRSESTPPPFEPAIGILDSLRRKRRFATMAKVAEGLLESGFRTPRIAIAYAQALIENGELFLAEALLRMAAPGARAGSFEATEMTGLMGRIAKQRYLFRGAASERGGDDLRAAIENYGRAYRMMPRENFWDGINAAALIARANRDGVRLATPVDPKAIAREVLNGLLVISKPSAWQLATILECHVALEDHAAAAEAALRYTRSDADAFELGSTLRQLLQVWQLKEDEPPGDAILPSLRATLLLSEGGKIKIAPSRIDDESKHAGVLEKNFGTERLKTFRWYQAGLERCRAIARIETKMGRGFGTGWLVDAAAFFPDEGAGDPLLITNAHVISTTHPDALTPDKARVNFMVTGTICDVEKILWSSPPSELDATIVKLRPAPGIEPLPLSSAALAMPPGGKREPRLYIIGHPAGRDLEFSLQDNVMLGSSDRFVHYRTPTEPGSSGSPVFEEDSWEVAALHHKGSARMVRLDGGDGFYEANEGILLQAIRAATAK